VRIDGDGPIGRRQPWRPSAAGRPRPAQLAHRLAAPRQPADQGRRGVGAARGRRDLRRTPEPAGRVRRWPAAAASSHARQRRALDRPPARVGADFLAFLRRIERVYPDHDLHVILDNVSTHKTPDVRAWLERHPRITLPLHPDLGARPFAGAASGA